MIGRLRLFALMSVFGACAGEVQSPYVAMVGTTETKYILGHVDDTLLAAVPTSASRLALETASENARSFFNDSNICVALFDARPGFVAYAASHCSRWKQQLVADGDLLFRLSADGRQVLATLLAPGGIELLGARPGAPVASLPNRRLEPTRRKD